MELYPVTRVQNAPPINCASEHMSTRNGRIFWQLILQASTPAKQPRVVTHTEPATIEQLLNRKYPGLVYNVCDASSPYWSTRSDFPHSLIFKHNLTASKLENWTPKTTSAVGGDDYIPPGSKAVAMHPAAAKRIERDPVFADDIMQRIDLWFSFDTARNEAATPGSTAGMSQGVAIGADGSIVNVVSIPAPEKGEDAYERWASTLWRTQQAANNVIISQQYAALDHAQTAAAQLAMMLNSGELQSVFGTTVGGVSTEDVVRETKKKVWGIES